MKFIELPIIDKHGNDNKKSFINPELVVMLISLPIPTGMLGPDGETPIVKPGTGVCLINGDVLPCAMTKEDTRKLLEDA